MKIYKVVADSNWFIVQADSIKEALQIANITYPTDTITEIGLIPYKEILKAEYPYSKVIKEQNEAKV